MNNNDFNEQNHNLNSQNNNLENADNANNITIGNTDNANNVDIENTNNETKLKKKKKKRLPLIILFALILSIIGYLYFSNSNKDIKQNKKENKITQEEIKVQEIPTNLALNSIFESKPNAYDNQAIIHNNKIYFAFFPENCTANNAVNEKASSNDLCEKYGPKKNENGTYDTDFLKLKIHLFVSDLNGENIQKIGEFERSNNTISFVLKTEKDIYFTNYEETFKLNVESNKIETLLKDEFEILPYPISNNDKIIAIKSDSLNETYTVNTYDAQTLRKLEETSAKGLYDYAYDVFEPNAFYTAFEPNDYYTGLDSNNNQEQNSYCYLYKNGKPIIKTKEINQINSFFVTKKYIFLLGKHLDKNAKYGFVNKTIKINKQNYKIEKIQTSTNKNEQKIDSHKVKYIGVGSDNHAYAYLDNDEKITFYKLSDNSTSLEKIANFNLEIIDKKGSTGNYIYIYKDYNSFIESEEETYKETTETNEIKNSNLIIYNTKINKLLKFDNVLYYYFDNDNLYTVQIIKDKTKLLKYNLN